MTDPDDAAARHELRLDLPAAHRAVRIARNVVRHFARLQGASDRDVDSVILVVSELLANVIDHAEGEDRMVLGFAIEDGEWSLEVTDHGGGDPAVLRALCAAEEPPDLEDERGRGMYLLGQMVDRLEVNANVDGDGITILARRRFES